MVQINLFRHSANAIDIEAGHVLFTAGDTGNVMIAVIDGAIELRDGDRVIETIEAGGILGEMALIDHAPRSLSAVAAAASRVVEVNERDFNFLVQQHPSFALNVMTIMAERLRRKNTA
jgi:CRP/FNR family transcriptional regulator, cyclic AMP receptor protein